MYSDTENEAEMSYASGPRLSHGLIFEDRNVNGLVFCFKP